MESLPAALEGLEPPELWKTFGEMTEVPRPSHEEEAVRQLFIEKAEAEGFEWETDGVGNLCIFVPGSPGHAEDPSVVLQGHMDMICAKNKGSEVDPAKDPLKLEKNEDFLTAVGTSLGADNGIGAAMAWEIALDPEAVHPPLEILLTVDEEDGMSGAENLDPKQLGMRGTTVINMDTEREGQVYLSSAGALFLFGERQLDMEDLSEDIAGVGLEISITGMDGGHSGVEIHEDRGNAILEMRNLLDGLPEGVRLISFNGGEAPNNIPREASALVFVPESVDLDAFRSSLSASFTREKGAVNTEIVQREDLPAEVIAMDTQRQILTVMGQVDNGVIEMSSQVPDLVETSNNLGVVETAGGKLTLKYAARSDVDEDMDAVGGEITEALSGIGFETKTAARLGAWKGDPDSPLASKMMAAWETVTGKKAETKGIHAGLEVLFVVLALKAALGKEIDAASVGPNMFDVHSPDERVEIPSVQRVYKQLKEALEMLAKAT